MARPLCIECPGVFYHGTSRGNEHKDVFKSQKDREKFLAYVESAGVRYGAVVHTWYLMRNHSHLLLATPLGNLAQIMRHINGDSAIQVMLCPKRLAQTACYSIGYEAAHLPALRG